MMVPPEIIDHVLSFLQRDHETLKVCARAHPSLSSLAERHIYARLTVSLIGRDCAIYSPSGLRKHIIARHVRSLMILLMDSSGNYQELESILPMVTQLQTISLEFIQLRKPVWDDLSEGFCTTFTNCLRLPTLTHATISGINGFPLSALCHSSSLKRLSLKGDFCCRPPVSPIVNPPLDFLNLYRCSSTSMEAVASLVEPHGLRSLRLNETNLDQSSHLLRVCSNTLTTLTVYIPSDYQVYYNTSSNDPSPFTPIPFSLAHLPHLARLTVEAPISFFQPHQHSCLPSTMHLLGTLPSPPTNLGLLVVSTNIFTRDSFNDISDTNWSPLISFRYFDVIPRFELQVCAKIKEKPIPSVELLKTLKRDRYLMQLERHPSFLINAVDKAQSGYWSQGQLLEA